jgi:hypothetical protein
MTTPAKPTPTKAVFYFRTLDRWPGGNADMVTVKVTTRLSPGAAPELEAQFYSCFDGRHAWFPPRRVTIDSGDALAAFLEVIRSLAARGESTLVVHPFDPMEDEWDCDWADSDIYLYTTEDGPETPDDASLRLIRRISKVKPRGKGKAPASDPELERAFELAHRLTGVGRVFQFANTKDALSAAYRAPNGPAVKDLGYALEATPTYLPPEADAGFLEMLAEHTRQRAAQQAAEQAAKQARKAAQRESLLVYRIDDLPEFLTRELSPDAGPRQCLFYIGRPGEEVVAAMMQEVPEIDHDETEAALNIADRIMKIVAESEDYTLWVRPPESLQFGGEPFGFHGGDAGAVERWLEARGVERVPLRRFLDRLILLRLIDEDGVPLEQVYKIGAGPPARTQESLGDGLFALPRDSDHARFELAPVSDEKFDDSSWLELRASNFPPGTVHTVTVPTPPARTKTPAKKTTGKALAKKTIAKKTPAKKTTAKKAAR